MKHDCFNLVDQDGIEFSVSFDYDYVQFNNEYGEHDAGYEIELKSTEVIIKGVGIDILPSLNEKQCGHIVQLLSEALDAHDARRIKNEDIDIEKAISEREDELAQWEKDTYGDNEDRFDFFHETAKYFKP